MQQWYRNGQCIGTRLGFSGFFKSKRTFFSYNVYSVIFMAVTYLRNFITTVNCVLGAVFTLLFRNILWIIRRAKGGWNLLYKQNSCLQWTRRFVFIVLYVELYDSIVFECNSNAIITLERIRLDGLKYGKTRFFIFFFFGQVYDILRVYILWTLPRCTVFDGD